MTRKPETLRAKLPSEAVERAWLIQLQPIVAACVHEENIVKAIAVSCYVQGALDARTPEFGAAWEEAS